MIRFVAALSAFFAAASVTNGAPQEVCATIGYMGLGIAAVWLFVEQFREPRAPR